jgi:antibiotic biosynthesis monooxygenase (ABM) superfamily enzyme
MIDKGRCSFILYMAFYMSHLCSMWGLESYLRVVQYFFFIQCLCVCCVLIYYFLPILSLSHLSTYHILAKN